MHRRTPGRGASSGIVVLILLALASTGALAAWDLNLPVGVTPISKIVYDLHMLILWICVAIGVVVFGIMFISIVRHRKAAGAQAARFHHSTFAEIAWTVIPIVILVCDGDTRDDDPHRDGGHHRRGPHRQGHGLSVEVEVRVHRRRAYGVQQSRRIEPSGHLRGSDENRELSSGGRQPHRVSGRQEGAPSADRRRRHPRVVGAGAGTEEGCNSRLHQRDLDTSRGTGGLSWPVRRALREGSWIHADRGPRSPRGGVQGLGRRAARWHRRSRRPSRCERGRRAN